MSSISRRRFLKNSAFLATTASLAGSAEPRETTRRALPAKTYGLLECADARLLAAVQRARNGILKCTVNDKTHCPDAGQQWGQISVLNDLYFGLHGAMYVADQNQHDVFRNELRKIGRFAQEDPTKTCLPWETSGDGTKPIFNNHPGMDMDRCAQFVLMTSRLYELTGDAALLKELYPACRTVVEALSKRDLDGDLLPEGPEERWYDESGQVRCAASSVSYIGDSVANTWKDFGAALFYWEALRAISQIEEAIGRTEDAQVHRARAERVRQTMVQTFWNDSSDGFLAWIEKDGTRHDDWITGNNLHAVASGLTSEEQSAKILACLNRNRAELEEIVPCRVRIGTYGPRLCSNRADYYWNGGIWTLVAASDMRARAAKGDLAGALHVAKLLSTNPEVTDDGFFEAYDGGTGKPNQCRGLLMNNGGFLWGFAEGVLGIDPGTQGMRFRPEVPRQILPAHALLRYRGTDVEITWKSDGLSSATLNGSTVPRDDQGYYQADLARPSKSSYRLEIKVAG